MAKHPLADSEVLIMAGTLLFTAASNDAIVFTAFKILSGCRTKTARAIFYTLDAFNLKRQLLTRLVDAVGDPEDKILVEAILDAAKKSNNQRQEISHSLLIWKGTGNIPYILIPKSKRTTPATKEWMQTLLRPSHEAANEGREAFLRLARKHRVSPKLVI